MWRCDIKMSVLMETNMAYSIDLLEHAQMDIAIGLEGSGSIASAQKTKFQTLSWYKSSNRVIDVASMG